MSSLVYDSFSVDMLRTFPNVSPLEQKDILYGSLVSLVPVLVFVHVKFICLLMCFKGATGVAGSVQKGLNVEIFLSLCKASCSFN